MQNKPESIVYFADVKVKKLERDKTLPAKFVRMLENSRLAEKIKNKKVCIKMHLGDKLGYTTIHPFFVRTLVEFLKKSGAKKIFVADGSKKGCEARGYTRKTVKAKIVGLFGNLGRTKKFHIGFKKLDEIEISKRVLDSDFLLVFSHVKGHGDAGFGAAAKNIAMGCIPSRSRSKLHSLEGGIEWNESKCKKCNKCIEECPNKANKFNDQGKYEVFWHNCKYCRHCILICPEGALKTTDITYEDFLKGMAIVNKIILQHFKNNIFFINMLMNITIFCDCWGLSTPSLVPDIGIIASDDLIAIDKASLDFIREENLIYRNNKPLGLPDDRELGEGEHLFEKIHSKNPLLLIKYLEEFELGLKNYKLIEIE